MDWQPTATAPEKRLVMTKIDDAGGARNEQPMVRQGNLWWINSGTAEAMYAYYRPTHWRELTADERAQEQRIASERAAALRKQAARLEAFARGAA